MLYKKLSKLPSRPIYSHSNDSSNISSFDDLLVTSCINWIFLQLFPPFQNYNAIFICYHFFLGFTASRVFCNNAFAFSNNARQTCTTMLDDERRIFFREHPFFCFDLKDETFQCGCLISKGIRFEALLKSLK